jgi:hypothetical protein
VASNLSRPRATRMACIRSTLGEPPTQLSGESQSSHRELSVGCDSDRGAQYAITVLVDHRSIVTDRESAASREVLRWSLEGSQAIRFRRSRCVSASRSAGCIRRQPRPKAGADKKVHERNSHDHKCGRGDKSRHQGSTREPSEDGRSSSRSRNRRHLPEVRCLSTESGEPIVDTLDCLPSAIRSQGFSPSQRFDPGSPSWLCFKPHPSLGFMGLQSFSRRGQPWCLSTPVALLPSGAPGRTGRTDTSVSVDTSVRANRTDMCDTPPEPPASELCSDRTSDTLRAG